MEYPRLKTINFLCDGDELTHELESIDLNLSDYLLAINRRAEHYSIRNRYLIVEVPFTSRVGKGKRLRVILNPELT